MSSKVTRFTSLLKFSLFVSRHRLAPTPAPLSSSAASISKKSRHRQLVRARAAIKGNAVIEAQLAPLRQAAREQSQLVRQLKLSDTASSSDIDAAVSELRNRNWQLEEHELSLSPPSNFDRTQLESLVKRRFFYDHSFGIYGSWPGFFDFGPLGTALKNNLIDEWRRHFVVRERMLQVDCSTLTPEPVLEASGHVSRFQDVMVRDAVSGECFRADHLVSDALEEIAKKQPDVRHRCEETLGQV